MSAGKLEKELKPTQGDITGIKLRLVHKEQAVLSVYDEAYPEIPLISENSIGVKSVVCPPPWPNSPST